MPFNRPGLKEIISRVADDVSSRTSDKVYPAAGSVADVFAHAIGGASHLLHAHLDWGIKQMLPSTASGEQLEEHARIWLSKGRKPAAAATGAVVIRGSNGTALPQGLLLARNDGVQFALAADYRISGGSVEAEVKAVAAGIDGNTEAGTILTMVSPLVGVESQASVGSSGISGGSEIESDEELRSRIIARIQQPPHGGADGDYVNWALEVPGVTRAWALPLKNGLGTVTVAVVRDNDENLIPDERALKAVADYIDSVRPVTARVYVVAPVEKKVKYRLTISPDTQLIRDSVEAALKAFHKREADLGGTLFLSRISEAISDVPGEFMHRLEEPLRDVTCAYNEILIFGGVIWSD